MLQKYDGYWDDNGIFPIGAPKKKGVRRKVEIIVLEEQEEHIEKVRENGAEKAFWAEFDRMAKESADENYVFEAFEPAKTKRELIIFSDEE